MQEIGVIPRRHIPKSLKQVVTVPSKLSATSVGVMIPRSVQHQHLKHQLSEKSSFSTYAIGIKRSMCLYLHCRELRIMTMVVLPSNGHIIQVTEPHLVKDLSNFYAVRGSFV